MQLIAPAKEHDKLVAMHTDGKMDKVLPILYDIGFNITDRWALRPKEARCPGA